MAESTPPRDEFDSSSDRRQDQPAPVVDHGLTWPPPSPAPAAWQPPTPPQGPLTPLQRRRNLATAVQMNVAAGWRVESQTDESAVLVKGGSTNHGLHLALTVVTCGDWGLAWLVVFLINQRQAVMLRVDEFGNVLRNHL